MNRCYPMPSLWKGSHHHLLAQHIPCFTWFYVTVDVDHHKQHAWCSPTTNPDISGGSLLSCGTQSPVCVDRYFVTLKSVIKVIILFTPTRVLKTWKGLEGGPPLYSDPRSACVNTGEIKWCHVSRGLVMPTILTQCVPGDHRMSSMIVLEEHNALLQNNIGTVSAFFFSFFLYQGIMVLAMMMRGLDR